MQITVRDNSPELGKDTGVQLVQDGLVKAEVDDNRYAEWADFIRSNRSTLSAGDRRQQWGHGFARDATEAEAFAIGQLTYLETKAFARWYAPLRYEEVLAGAISYEAGPWAKQVDYLVSDEVGIGRRMSPTATDMPMADVAYAKVSIPVEIGGAGYDYTVEDLVTSSFLGQPLPMTKQAAAIMMYRRHMNRVALIGELNFKGFYNNAAVTTAATTSAANWNVATADTIINDVIVAYAAYIQAGSGNVFPQKLIFPLSTYQLLLKPRSTVSDTTILKFLTQTLNVEIMSDVALETLGSGTSTKRVVFCATTGDNVVLHIPRPMQFLAPQMEGLRIVVPGSYKYAGCEVRRIQTVRYMDGV